MPSLPHPGLSRWFFALIILSSPLIAAACGGGGTDGGSSGITNPPPPPPPPTPVASVALAPATSSVLAGATVQLTATARDAAGNAISGRTITFASSNMAVATVGTSGLVTSIAPGTATITATSEGQSATATVESVDPTRIPAFSRPFDFDAVDYYTTNFHDHDVPRAFFDNGRKVAYWGEQYNATGYEGHQGYDWLMPTGTPILAVANGTVISLSNAAFACPILNTTIPADGNGYVVVEHDLPGGVRVRTLHAHLSRKDVRVGDRVTAGQQIGLSGGVGCALNPHLHFEVRRLTQTKDGQPSVIDPYGWEGTGVDPWLNEPDGAASIHLWKPDEAPRLLTRVVVDINASAATVFFALSAVQAMGVRDAQNVNNEYLEVSRDLRIAPATLSIAGAQIRTRSGVVFTFPAGATLSTATPTIRVYTGAGTNTATTYYMGRTTEAYNNLSECVEVWNSAAQLRGRVGWGGGCS